MYASIAPARCAASTRIFFAGLSNTKPVAHKCSSRSGVYLGENLGQTDPRKLSDRVNSQLRTAISLVSIFAFYARFFLLALSYCLGVNTC